PTLTISSTTSAAKVDWANSLSRYRSSLSIGGLGSGGHEGPRWTGVVLDSVFCRVPGPGAGRRRPRRNSETGRGCFRLVALSGRGQRHCATSRRCPGGSVRRPDLGAPRGGIVAWFAG